MQSLLPWTRVLSLLLWVGVGKAECVFPDENGNLPKQHIVVVDRIPVHLSAAIRSNTTISVAGTTVPVTNAPTVLLTDFIVENTITLTSKLSPITPFNGPYTTITRGVPQGSSTSTITLDPQDGSELGTQIVLQPLPSDWQGPFNPIIQTRLIVPWGFPTMSSVGGETAFPRSLIVITAPWTGSVTNTVLLPPRPSDEVGTRILLTPASEPFTGSLTAVTQPWTGMVPTTITLPARGTDTIGTQLVLTPVDASAPTDPPLARSFTTMTGVWTGTALSTVELPPAGRDSIGTRVLLRPSAEGGESDPAPSPRLFIDITATGTGAGTDPTTITIPPAGTGTLTIATRLVLNPAATPGSGGSTGNGNRPLDPFGRLFIPPETAADDRFITITSTTTGADPTTLTFLPAETGGGTGTVIVFDTPTVTVATPTGGGLVPQILLPTRGGSDVSPTTPGGPINPAELVDVDSSAVSSPSGQTSGGPIGNNILTSPDGGSSTDPVPDITSTPVTQPALLTSGLDVPATSTTTDPGLPRLLLTTTSSGAPATSDSDSPTEPFEFPDDEVVTDLSSRVTDLSSTVTPSTITTTITTTTPLARMLDTLTDSFRVAVNVDNYAGSLPQLPHPNYQRRCRPRHSHLSSIQSTGSHSSGASVPPNSTGATTTATSTVPDVLPDTLRPQSSTETTSAATVPVSSASSTAQDPLSSGASSSTGLLPNSLIATSTAETSASQTSASQASASSDISTSTSAFPNSLITTSTAETSASQASSSASDISTSTSLLPNSLLATSTSQTPSSSGPETSAGVSPGPVVSTSTDQSPSSSGPDIRSSDVFPFGRLYIHQRASQLPHLDINI
ncbi:hypothetical protein CSHISOI_08005 [Colletotrichum shisoi]|uniref:Uncharacterized protein n=1 Tax=Colletotrichum shisoi TaxID=2078593 RepID=A0A5Q4BKX0_9PEZI|nr:hypothetical protein CSHISOI_08005 [Colletotrichum shisoi]